MVIITSRTQGKSLNSCLHSFYKLFENQNEFNNSFHKTGDDFKVFIKTLKKVKRIINKNK